MNHREHKIELKKKIDEIDSVYFLYFNKYIPENGIKTIKTFIKYLPLETIKGYMHFACYKISGQLDDNERALKYFYRVCWKRTKRTKKYKKNLCQKRHKKWLDNNNYNN